MYAPIAGNILISGGAGYIGSHVAHALRSQGYNPIVLDSLISGHAWAVRGPFCRCDISDTAVVRALVQEFQPVAALHFAAFIEVGESVRNPSKYFLNNRDKAKAFFDNLAGEGLRHIVFSSTAAVYGEPQGAGPLTENAVTQPVNPYGWSKLEAETYLRTLNGVTSASLRYFNVAGAAPEVGLGEAHLPESHLIPRLVLPLIDLPAAVAAALDLTLGFRIYGEDYATPDGTAVRDYLHVLDLAEAHVLALRYLLDGGQSQIFNLGTGIGNSVKEVVQAARKVLNRPHFMPLISPRRPGDPAILVASGEKARAMLRWQPAKPLDAILASAASWHESETYKNAILAKLAAHRPKSVIQ